MGPRGVSQSNFNADNLIGGATVDYSPFGFIERYRELGDVDRRRAALYFMNRRLPRANFRQFTAVSTAPRYRPA